MALWFLLVNDLKGKDRMETVYFIGAWLWEKPRPKIIKLFSCSSQLNMEFILPINIKMPTFHPPPCWARKKFNFLFVFDTYKQAKIHAQSFITSGHVLYWQQWCFGFENSTLFTIKPTKQWWQMVLQLTRISSSVRLELIGASIKLLTSYCSIKCFNNYNNWSRWTDKTGRF